MAELKRIAVKDCQTGMFSTNFSHLLNYQSQWEGNQKKTYGSRTWLCTHIFAGANANECA